jgi:hypothetical protein
LLRKNLISGIPRNPSSQGNLQYLSLAKCSEKKSYLLLLKQALISGSLLDHTPKSSKVGSQKLLGCATHL